MEAKIIGRYISDEEGIKHTWTGSGIEFDTYSSDLVLKVYAKYSSYEIWLAVELNGARIIRTMLLPGLNTIPLYKNLNSKEKRNIRIIKDSQAHLSGEENYMSVINVEDLKGNEVDTFMPKEKSIAIEFIGDSITSGEGLKGALGDMDFSYCYTSFEGNYAKLVSDYFDADYSIVSQCGYGVICGWNNDPSMNMQEVYKYADGKSIPYNFDKRFDYVVINLGTNDNGARYQDAFNGFKVTQEAFVNGVKEFLGFVMEKNPEAKIIWITGMCEIDFANVIEDIIKSINSDRVYFIKTESNDELDNGSRNHPGLLTHKMAAEKIIMKLEGRK